jgi:hypothetical protein
VKTGVPLFHGPLCRTDRPWDAVLPDGKRRYVPLNPLHKKRRPRGHFHNLGPRYSVPPYPLPEQYIRGDASETQMPRSSPVYTHDLPEEVLPTPEQSWSSDDVEIITDQ